MSKTGEDLHRVGAGLRLVLLGLAAAAVAGVSRLLVALSEPGKDLVEQLAALQQDRPTTAVILTGLVVLAVVLGIAGKALCLAVPAASRATTLILMALGSSALGLALNVAAALEEQGDPAGELFKTGVLLTILGYVFFLRFLGRLAAYLGSAPLAARARRILVGTLGIGLVLLALGLGAEAGATPALGAAALLVAVGTLVLFVSYARVILDLWRETVAAAEVAVDDD